MQVIHFDILSSTQDYAFSIITKDTIHEDILIIAGIQTDGRGRLKQRKWVSDYGNFHGSFVINIEKIGIGIDNVSILNEFVMHSVFSFLNNIINNNALKIKLPNDIYYNNKKLAGVLIEVMYPYAIIGIGINVYNSPIDTATSLCNIINNDDIIFDQKYGLSEKYCYKLYKELTQNLLS